MAELQQRILLVEDEPGLVMTLTDRLAGEGYSVDSEEDGEAGLARALSSHFDLILLDVMLPKKSGFDVCRKLRQSGINTPVLMLTARGQVVDKVVGLQIGADDYLTKPFDMMELLARIEALLRRAPSRNGAAAGVFEFDGVKVDFRSSSVTNNGEAVNLSAREFQLLKYLIEHRDSTVTRDQLLTDVWGYDATLATRTVDVHMAWLRQKLEENPKHPKHILTLRGLGYKFTA